MIKTICLSGGGGGEEIFNPPPPPPKNKKNKKKSVIMKYLINSFQILYFDPGIWSEYP